MSRAQDLARIADLLRLIEQTVGIIARPQTEGSYDLQATSMAIREAIAALDAALLKGLIANSNNEYAGSRTH